MGEVVDDDALTISANGAELARLDRADLQKAWTEVSWQIARGRDNPACADSEFARIERKEDTASSRRPPSTSMKTSPLR